MSMMDKMVRETYADIVRKETGKRVSGAFFITTDINGNSIYGLTGNNHKLIAVVIPIDDENYELYY